MRIYMHVLAIAGQAVGAGGGIAHGAPGGRSIAIIKKNDF